MGNSIGHHDISPIKQFNFSKSNKHFHRKISLLGAESESNTIIEDKLSSIDDTCKANFKFLNGILKYFGIEKPIGLKKNNSSSHVGI